MERNKKVAVVAHDNKKRDLIEWAKYNRDLLAHHTVYATGTTGALMEMVLGFHINKLESGPLGGDQQIGAKIVNGAYRLPDLLLGSTRVFITRPGCQSAFTDCYRVEHSHRL